MIMEKPSYVEDDGVGCWRGNPGWTKRPDCVDVWRGQDGESVSVALAGGNSVVLSGVELLLQICNSRSEAAFPEKREAVGWAPGSWRFQIALAASTRGALGF